MPERDGAVIGDLDAVEAFDDVVRAQVLRGVAQGQHHAHEDALLTVFHLVRLPAPRPADTGAIACKFMRKQRSLPHKNMC